MIIGLRWQSGAATPLPCPEEFSHSKVDPTRLESGMALRFPPQSKTKMIRVVLPFHLRNLARVAGEVELEVAAPVTIRAVVDALETNYPVLRGTVRDHGTLKRRPFIRFFACQEDVSLEPPETPLPEAVVKGKEPFLIVGAMAGG